MIVKLSNGCLIKGKQGLDYDGNKYLSFQRIPYAKPPIGNLRFKDPQPVDPWDDVLDATKEAEQCISKNMITKILQGSEDCLYLNVYSNNVDNKKLQPVMVWIHGGGFVTGSGNTDIYGPEYLLTQNVILVTFNYRLGILGFLSLKEPNLQVPGNAGLKDQNLALKWVKNNISNFGGDANNITIFGHSAGGASVDFHLISPLSKGLFNKAILLSGNSMCSWATGVRFGNKVASILGFESSNEAAILKFLQQQPAEKFVQIQNELKESTLPSSPRYLSPTIEDPNPNAFLTEHPIELLEKGKFAKVPIMSGYTTQESIFFKFFEEFMQSQPLTDFGNAIPYTTGIKPGTEEYKRMANKIEQFYFGNSDPFTEENLPNFYTLATDLAVLKDTIIHAKIVKKHSDQPLYLYRFNLESELNFFKKVTELTNIPGVSHGDELPYIFKASFSPEIKAGSIEDVWIRKVVKLFGNFANYSNPTPDEQQLLIKWEPVRDTDKLNCYEIGVKFKNHPQIPENDRITFWEQLLNIKI